MLIMRVGRILTFTRPSALIHRLQRLDDLPPPLPPRFRLPLPDFGFPSAYSGRFGIGCRFWDEGEGMGEVVGDQEGCV
jgi:hypothetical protein